MVDINFLREKAVTKYLPQETISLVAGIFCMKSKINLRGYERATLYQGIRTNKNGFSCFSFVSLLYSGQGADFITSYLFFIWCHYHWQNHWMSFCTFE